MRVIIFTDRYPYGQYEESFLEGELAYLATRAGECEVVVVPLKGDTFCRAVPRGVRVERPLLSGRGRVVVLLRLFFPLLLLRASLWRFVGETLLRLLRGERVARVWYARYVGGELVARYALEAMRDGGPGVLYSYWMSYGALGIALAKGRASRGGQWRCVSRAHGYDIREGERGIPLRGFTWRQLDAVYAVSEAGARVLRQQRGAIGGKVYVANLGIEGIPRACEGEIDDDRVLFVSCSGVRPVKRLDLMLRLVVAYASARGGVRVEWVHFGDGELLGALRRESAAASRLVGNFSVQWRGGMANADVLRAYGALVGAIFLNTSESEGLPVSIMEAMSAGFPVVATDVGGTAEALRGGAGELLDAMPTEGEFARAVEKVRQDYAGYSERARGVFEARFRAAVNYRVFYDSVCGVGATEWS